MISRLAEKRDSAYRVNPVFFKKINRTVLSASINCAGPARGPGRN